MHEAHLNASPSCIQQLKEETAKDEEMSLLKDVIMEGWPEERRECPYPMRKYWNYRDELGVENGIILKGTRIVVPKSLQQEVLAQLHQGHLGIEKCRLRARGSVFWDNINKDIEDAVRDCPECQTYQAAPPKEPLLPHDIPPHPWHTVATDLFHWNANTYLLVVDTFSKYPIIRKLNSMSAGAVIMQMKGICEEYGIPQAIMSDNGPQYSAKEFR